MSGAFFKVHKARKNYRCPAVWAHDPIIRKGQPYARVKVPPAKDGYFDSAGNTWSEYAFHLDCVDDERSTE